MSHVSKEIVRKEYYRLLDTLDVGSQNAVAVNDYLSDMRAAAMRLSNLSLRECNGVIGPDGFAKWDEGDQEECDKARAAAEKRVLHALDMLFDAETRKRIVTEFQGDPRGPSVQIHVEGRRNIVTLY